MEEGEGEEVVREEVGMRDEEDDSMMIEDQEERRLYVAEDNKVYVPTFFTSYLKYNFFRGNSYLFIYLFILFLKKSLYIFCLNIKLYQAKWKKIIAFSCNFVYI